MTVSVFDSQEPAQIALRTMNLHVEVPVGCEDNTTLPEMECSALVAFAEATSGDTDSWGGGDPCDWKGLVCGNGHVVVISLPTLVGDGLEGTLVPELAHLTELQRISLSGNRLTGPIPAEIGRLEKLETFDLARNDLEGPIPPELADIPFLRFVYLDDNRLSGELPESLGEIMFLTQLSLGGNQLEGNIPEWIGYWVYLDYLDLSDNRFTGPVPDNLADLSDLLTLSLANNSLEGPVPDGVRWLPLYHLDLSGNGCLTASEETSDFLTSLDKAWQDGCPLMIDTTALPDARVGEAYDFRLRASGGTREYEWSAMGLPEGLSIDQDGVISGTPSSDAAGNHLVEITVVEQNEAVAQAAFNLSVGEETRVLGVDECDGAEPASSRSTIPDRDRLIHGCDAGDWRAHPDRSGGRALHVSTEQNA